VNPVGDGRSFTVVREACQAHRGKIDFDPVPPPVENHVVGTMPDPLLPRRVRWSQARSGREGHRPPADGHANRYDRSRGAKRPATGSFRYGKILPG
jgi:hypothetical protein